MNSDPRNNTMAFVVSQKLKDRIISEAEKQGIKVSRFVANTMEEKINELNQQPFL